MQWADCLVTWNSLRSDWVQWGRRRCGFALDPHIPSRGGPGDNIISHRPQPTAIYPVSSVVCDSVHMFIDSMIMARVMQGRWKTNQAWPTRLRVHANDFMYTMGSVSGDHHEYWWISHVTRWHTAFADAMSMCAREVALLLTLLVFDTALWESWLAQ